MTNALYIDTKAYPYFYNPWHFHPELELTLVIESYGQRLIGDSIENFEEGDLVLVGSNLPHVWKNDESFFNKEDHKRARAIVAKFMPDFLGRDILNLNEMRCIKELIYEKAVYGIKPRGELKSFVADEMMALPDLDDAGRIILLLKILYHLSKSHEYDFLTSLSYRKNFLPTNDEDNLRINVVLDYLLKNYQRKITLEELASLIYLNKNAFCRFFKVKTGKSVFQLLAEIRIGKACQMLQYTEKSVGIISATVGFNNISNFNRAFKLITGSTPLSYKKAYQ